MWQEKRGFFFCLEDRALLCRDCDVSIHSANALSGNHKRFLVTGMRAALEDLKDDHEPPTIASPATSSQSSHCSRAFSLSSPTSTLQRPQSTPTPDPKSYRAPTGYAPCCPPAPFSGNGQGIIPEMGASVAPVEIVSMGLRRSFSEFLTDAVPGWRVDELLNFVDCNEGFNNTDSMACAKGDGVPGDYDWTADLSLFEEQMFASHEVPQFPAPAAPSQLAAPSSRSRHVRNNRSTKLDMYHLPNNSYGDAFVVPEIRIPSGPPSSSFPKRLKRDLHH